MPSSLDLRNVNQQVDEQRGQDMPVRAVVHQVFPNQESMKVESFGRPGYLTMTVRHPYMSTNSWFRCMPEAGTSLVTQRIRQPRQPEIWGYISHRLGEQVQKARDSDKYIFRELRPGEMEALSSGRAYTHWSEDGNLSLQGGVIESVLSQTELEHTSRAPTHKRHLDQHEPNQLGHEERFGLVKRPDSSKPYSLQVYAKDGSDFQYEYGRWIKDDSGSDVISLHEGHLWDQNGNQIKNGQTNRKVRLRRTINHRSSGTFEIDVDEELNIVLNNSSKAKTTDLDFGRLNEIKISSKKFDLSVLKSSNQTFTQSLTIKSPKQRYNGTDIGFGPSPTQPAVLGTTLNSSVLTPLLSILLSLLGVIAADTNVTAATSGAAGTAITGVSTLLSNLPNVLSQQVKFTA